MPPQSGRPSGRHRKGAEAHGRRRIETRRRRVLSPLRGRVPAQRRLERVEAGDRDRGHGDRHAGLVGERGGEVGARLPNRGGKVDVGHEHETAGHALIERPRFVGHSARS